MEQFNHVILTQDFHPRNHISFASQYQSEEPFNTINLNYGPQVLWPPHCIQGTSGCEFHDELNTDRAELIIRKGMDINLDSYSAFLENDKKTQTGLSGYLEVRQYKEIHFCGLATDFCVAWSVLDCFSEFEFDPGMSFHVHMDCCAAIDLEGSLNKAINNMEELGVELIYDSFQ